MRTSGRGGSEALMFIAPAAIFGTLFLWLHGGPRDLLREIDGALLRFAHTAAAWLAAWTS